MFASAYFPWDWGSNPNKEHARTVHSPPELKGAKALVLWGGEDISPALYAQVPYSDNSGPRGPSRRDQCEYNLITAAVQEGIPILGICRGAQLLCAAGGGSLYQHVDGHVGRDHEVVVGDRVYWSNSCHHQMMIPTEDMKVLGHVPKPLSFRKWMDQRSPVEKSDPEPELVYMPKLKALAVQGHPEWLPYSCDYVKLIRDLFGEYFHVEL